MTGRTVVLVHGAWHDSRGWAKVVEELREAGVPVEAVDLPLTSFEADVEAVRAACTSVAGAVVLVGHS
jgi:pimeloyl-ACP methyl ester carboxylesterase